MARLWFVVNIPHLVRSFIGDYMISSADKGLSVDQRDGVLQLVLHALPIIKRLTLDPDDYFKPRDRRHGSLGNIHTAASVLDSHLRAIMEAGKSGLFEAQMERLADLLEDIFDDTTIDFVQLNVSVQPGFSDANRRACSRTPALEYLAIDWSIHSFARMSHTAVSAL